MSRKKKPLNKPDKNRSPLKYLDYLVLTMQDENQSGKQLISRRPDVLKKRKNVILKTIPQVEKSFKKYGLHGLLGMFIQLEMTCDKPYEVLDENANIRTAAALWMLDELNKNGSLEKAKELLPDKSPEHLVIPEINHPLYSRDLIRRVVASMPEMLLCDKPSQSFIELVKLLPPERVNEAGERFKRRQWELLSRYFKTCLQYDKEQLRLITEYRESAGKLGYNAQTKLRDRNKRTSESLMHEESCVYDRLSEILIMDKEEIMKRTSLPGVADAIYGMTIKDPFEFCFATVYLLASGDESMWLIGSGSTLVGAACCMLPWAKIKYEDAPETLDYDYNNWRTKENPADMFDYYHTMIGKRNAAQLVYQWSHGVIPPLLHPFGEEKRELIKQGVDEQSAHLVAQASELCFMSAFRQDIENGQQETDRPIEEEPVYAGMIGYWGEVARQYIIHNGEIDLPTQEASALKQVAEKPVEEQLREAREDNKQKEADLRKANDRIKELENLLASANKQNKREKQSYEDKLSALRMEHRELADLRELVFKEQNDVQESTEISPDIELPYTTKKRTVIFGGHDRFLKAIKPMLPDVKFVDSKNMTYSPEIIRNADIIWVQTNHISHPQYWSIVKNCKMANKQLRYFTYVSAEKCAEQLILADKKQ